MKSKEQSYCLATHFTRYWLALCLTRMGRPRGGSALSEDEEMMPVELNFDDIEVESVDEEEEELYAPGQGPFGFGLRFHLQEEDVIEIGTFPVTPFKHFNNWMYRERFAYIAGQGPAALTIADIMGYADVLDEHLLEVLAQSIIGSHSRNECYANYVLSMEIAMLEYHGHPNWPTIRTRMVNAINLLWAWDKGIIHPPNWEGTWPLPDAAPYLGPSGEVV